MGIWSRSTDEDGQSLPGIERLVGLVGRSELWARRHFKWVALVVILTAVLNELILFGPQVEDWDFLYVTSVLTLLLGLWVGLILPEKVEPMLNTLSDRESLRGDPKNLAAVIIVRGDRWANRGGFLLAIIVLMAFLVVYWDVYPSQLMFTFFAVVAAYFVGRIASRLVAIGSLGFLVAKDDRWSIKPNPWHHDGAAGLQPVGELYFRQASALMIPALFFAVWWFLLPLFGYDRWRSQYLALLAVTIVVQILAFVVPMASFHRLMKNDKAARLSQADRKTSPRLASIEEELAFTADKSQRAVLKEEASLLRDYYKTISETPTWPVDSSIRRRFRINNVVLFLPVIGSFIGNSEVWENIASALGEVFGNGG